MGFVAYDCANGTNRVDAYSLLEPAACPTREDHHEVERTIFGEIVQMKKDRTVPVFRCTVIEFVMSQYCEFNSAGGVVRYITFREPRRVEAQECRAVKETGNMSVGGQEFKVTRGTTISHSTFLHGDLTDRSNCETGVLELPGGRKIGGQATQAIYKITVLEEYAKLNDLTGTITVASGISAKVGDLSLADPMEGTYVLTHQEEECPRTLVQLYRGPIKIFSNRSSTLEGSLALMAGLELGTMFVLCGNSTLHTHILNIAVFAHQDHQMEMATGRFKDQPAGTDVTKLETTMSFLQIKASVGLHEKIRQVRHEICQNRRETAQVRLEAIAEADNPYSLLQVFGRGHVIAKNGAVAFVTRCNPVEVLPRVSNNCTE